MICPHCKDAYTENSNYCHDCGEPLSAAAVGMAPRQQPVGVRWLRSLTSWKMFLPLIGMGIALLGYLLPWFRNNGLNISGFTFMNVAFQKFHSFDKSIQPFILVVIIGFWFSVVCALSAHLLLWRNRVSRVLVLVMGVIGLMYMIGMTFVLIFISKDKSAAIHLNPGYLIALLGFTVIFIGTIIAWCDLEVVA